MNTQVSDFSLQASSMTHTDAKGYRVLTRKLLSMSIVLLLTTCVSRVINNWPDSVPEQNFFISAYKQDALNRAHQSEEEYLQWILSFYQGSRLYSSGWLELEANMLLITTPSSESRLLAQLHQLGMRIAAEWAKHNDVRLIDSRMLSLWGSILQLTPDIDGQMQAIEVFRQDIAELLAGRLAAPSINAARYEEILQIQLFGCF